MTYYLIRHGTEYFQGTSVGPDLHALLKNITVITTRLERFENRADSLLYTESHGASGQSEWRLEFSSVLEAEIFLLEFHRLRKAKQ